VRADLSSSLLYGAFVFDYEMTLEVVSSRKAASALLARESVRCLVAFVSEVVRLEVVSSLRGEGTLRAWEARPAGVIRSFDPLYDQRAKAGLERGSGLYRGRRTWLFRDKGRVDVESVFGH